MLPEYVNIRHIDKRVKELVVRLNRLPYIVTISSCESHVYAGTNGTTPWKLDEGLITIQTDGSDKARGFVEWLRGFCSRYEFIYFMGSEAQTEEGINSMIKDGIFRVYGFKFPLGKEEYHIITDPVKGNKESIIDSKRKVNEFWKKLTSELTQYENY